MAWLSIVTIIQFKNQSIVLFWKLMGEIFLCSILMESWVSDEQLFPLYVIDAVDIVNDSISALSPESFKSTCQWSWTYFQNYWTSNNSFALILYLTAFNFYTFLFFCKKKKFFFFCKKSWSILLLRELLTLKLQIPISHFHTILPLFPWLPSLSLLLHSLFDLMEPFILFICYLIDSFPVLVK